MYDEPEITIHAVCSMHELFLLILDKFSFKSVYMYLNHDFFYLGVSNKKMINSFPKLIVFLKLALINDKSILHTQRLFFKHINVIVTGFNLTLINST